MAVWERILKNWKGQTSIFNSAAIRTKSTAWSDWARAGFSLYGGQIEGIPRDKKLLPTSTLTTKILSIRKVPKGETVGYGGIWTAERDSLIATLPLGYADGYPRSAVNGTPAMING